MKIAFINIYQGAVERGAETYVRELSKRLSERHKVTVLSFNTIPKKRWPIIWRAYLDPFGVQTFWYALKLVPKILKEKYDVVIPVNGGWQPALVRLITWVYGGRMIISGQSGIGWDDRNNLWCFPNCFVAISGYAKNWAKRVNPLVNVNLIPNGVDVEKFSKEKQRINFKLEKPLILCVAALAKSKRLDLVIKAVSKLETGSLVLVGKGEEENNLKKIGEKLLGNRFKITSYTYSDMPKVYKTADLFTFSTNPNESFGIVMLEAMAANLPIVASDDPIRREIVGNSGMFVDPTDTLKYSSALEDIFNKKWGKKPYKQAQKYDWDNIANEYDKLFNDLMQ